MDKQQHGPASVERDLLARWVKWTQEFWSVRPEGVELVEQTRFLLSRPPQPPSASDERERFMREFQHLPMADALAEGCAAFVDPKTQGAWEGWQARAALAPSPGVDAAERDRDRLRVEQATAVMSLIGPLLDAWEYMDNDGRAALHGTNLARVLSRINLAMEHGHLAAPSPAASAPKHRTLQDQIRDAKAEVAAWEPDRREAVVLQGPRDPHPPSRACLCAECKPSFENGADDPARRYDITRGVTAASADEWMAEVIEMVKSMGGTLEEITEDRDALYVHLLAHLKARP